MQFGEIHCDWLWLMFECGVWITFKGAAQFCYCYIDSVSINSCFLTTLEKRWQVKHQICFHRMKATLVFCHFFLQLRFVLTDVSMLTS